MGVADLKEAFNAGANPYLTCERALLDYERHSDVQYQRLTFRGTGADGVPFEARSDLLRPDADVNLAARELGQKMVEAMKPKEGQSP